MNDLNDLNFFSELPTKTMELKGKKVLVLGLARTGADATVTVHFRTWETS